MKLLKEALEQIILIQEIGDLSAGALPMTKPNFLPRVKKIMSDLEAAYKRYKHDGITLDGITTYVAEGESGQLYDIKIGYSIETYKSKFSSEARIDFDIKGNKKELKDTNLKEQYKLVSSVVLAMLDFTNKIEPIAPLKYIAIYPKADDSEDSQVDSKRGRFYKVYITKNLDKLPGKWKVIQKQERFELERLK